jgi:hypothetical protein
MRRDGRDSTSPRRTSPSWGVLYVAVGLYSPIYALYDWSGFLNSSPTNFMPGSLIISPFLVVIGLRQIFKYARRHGSNLRTVRPGHGNRRIVR